MGWDQPALGWLSPESERWDEAEAWSLRSTAAYATCDSKRAASSAMFRSGLGTPCHRRLSPLARPGSSA
eukprot:322145-Rhodomonas_salina.1